jgi:ATP-dependent DNA helicase RecG
MLGKTLRAVLEKLPELPEWHDPALISREKWPDWRQAVLLCHSPEEAEKSPFAAVARRRLAYDELLTDQLALAVVRRHHREAGGRKFQGDGKLRNKLIQSLPFELTEGQKQAAAEIAADMEAPRRMLRLLQGDVGSGKTIVALLAMLHAVESGAQAALMAPTEILAKQHHEKLSAILRPFGIEIGLLIGKGRGKERQSVVEKLAKGEISLVVGTHALFQNDIVFRNLGLAVVDEQHRFGVQQRLLLSEKGRGVDILVMTATPIPRTLCLTAYGDMDVSRLLEKPAGRQPIDTRLIDLSRLDEVIGRLAPQLQNDKQVYWVCPLVEESEKSDLAAATERAELLRQRFGADKVGLIHGRMKAEEKDAVMAAFVAGKTKILVATTVIEVGVDVANASIMIVEHAERFGLAQLHQLRGRVGRGSEKSACLLLYQAPLGETSKARLGMMRETTDGFKIAEEDLRLRGPGEVLGTRQSGAPEFRLANLGTDGDLLAIAHDDAMVIMNKDPSLSTPRGKALRVLLYLFEKDATVPLFRAG